MKKIYLYLIIFIALFAVRFWVSTFSFNNDMLNHQAWVESIAKDGFAGFYDREVEPFAKPNYPPLITAGFYYLDNAAQSLHISDYNIIFALYKIPAVIVETIAIVLLLAIAGPFAAIVAAINPGVAYNTLLWGQTEGLVSGLILICLYLLNKKRPVWALVVFALSLLVKQSAIIFLPLIFIILFKNFNIKKALISIGALALTTLVPFIPFAGIGFTSFAFKFFLDASAGQEHQWQASVNALNFWFLAGQNLIPDSVKFLAISYRLISIVITGLLILFILFNFIRKKYSLENSLLAGALINFAVCMFLTRVHERHLLPSLLLLVPFAIKSGRSFALYAIMSFIYFANLYLIWHGEFFSFDQNILKALSLINVLIFIYFLYIQSRPKSAS